MSLQQLLGVHLRSEALEFLDKQLFPWYKSTGLSRIQACIKTSTRQHQCNLSENHVGCKARNCSMKGAFPTCQRPHQFYEHLKNNVEIIS